MKRWRVDPVSESRLPNKQQPQHNGKKNARKTDNDSGVWQNSVWTEQTAFLKRVKKPFSCLVLRVELHLNGLEYFLVV